MGGWVGLTGGELFVAVDVHAKALLVKLHCFLQVAYFEDPVQGPL